MRLPLRRIEAHRADHEHERDHGKDQLANTTTTGGLHATTMIAPRSRVHFSENQCRAAIQVTIESPTAAIALACRGERLFVVSEWQNGP